MPQLQPSTYVPITLNGCFSAALPTSGANIMMLATTNDVLFISVFISFPPRLLIRDCESGRGGEPSRGCRPPVSRPVERRRVSPFSRLLAIRRITYEEVLHPRSS